MIDEKNLRIMEGIAKGLSLDEIAEYAGVSKKLRIIGSKFLKIWV